MGKTSVWIVVYAGGAKERLGRGIRLGGVGFGGSGEDGVGKNGGCRILLNRDEEKFPKGANEEWLGEDG